MESKSDSQPMPSGPEMVKLYISYIIPAMDEDVTPIANPKVKIFTMLNDFEQLYGETEVAQNKMEIDFVTTFTLYYRFQAKQPLRFEVASEKNNKLEPISSINTTLGDIIGTKDQAIVFRLVSKRGAHGKLVVKCEKIIETNSTAFFEISARKLNSSWLSQCSFYFTLGRPTESGTESEIYKSEILKKDANPKWRSFHLLMDVLCGNQSDAVVNLNVYKQKYFGTKLLGQCSFTVDELMENRGKEFVLSKPNKKKKYGILEISNFKLGKNATFTDFLREGVQITPIIVSDFSLKKSSSYNVEEEFSLIFELSEILIQNNTEKKIALYGIGGKPLQWTEEGKLFPFNGHNDDPWICGIEKIKEKYFRVMMEKLISEQTLYYPALEKAIQLAKESKAQGSKEYVVVIIITKGTSQDLEETFRSLVGCDLLPLSILFVGMGKRNFENMTIFQKERFFLPEDKNQRNFVQFFQWTQGESVTSLIEEALGDVPNQLLKYMKMNNITVGPKKKLDTKKILATKKTFNLDDYGAGPRSILLNDLLEVRIFDNRRKSVGVFGRDEGFTSYLTNRFD